MVRGVRPAAAACRRRLCPEVTHDRPAPIRSRPGGHFSRDGENDEAKIVPNPERAAVSAVLMIAGRGQPPCWRSRAALRQSRLTVTPLHIKDVTGTLRARHYRAKQNGNEINASVMVDRHGVTAIAVDLETPTRHSDLSEKS